MTSSQRSKGGTGRGRHAAPNQSFKDMAFSFMNAHGALTGVGIAVIVFASFALTLWFIIFSGLASSADFIYSQF